ncbi:MAG: ElaB/YqjD/DUF883 family membrane-anchored ribosome-binding protein [Brevundimonas sp.]|jgi:ElaB/YqjD/DUF883 family membrane-anchored ribosome-binding protein|uniref:hypothetical protein n=1 Tax=Brevundimonas sp. TaxID=1871086 RepID=UPI0039E5D7CB
MTDTLSQTDTTNTAYDPVLSPRPDLAAQPATADDRAPMTARVERRLREGRTWAEDRTQRAGEVIRAHPLRSSLGAVGVGVVLGMLLRR